MKNLLPAVDRQPWSPRGGTRREGFSPVKKRQAKSEESELPGKDRGSFEAQKK